MFKTVIVVRHAKSSWDNPLLSDFERTLNERGKRDAPVMAQRLRDRKIVVDCFISSPAKRALETAIVFAEMYGRKKSEIITLPELYHAPPETLLQAVYNAPAAAQCIALFAHNPGITAFVNTLTPHSVRTDNVPTCGMFAVQVLTSNWQQFENAAKEFLFFDYPKAQQA